MKPNKILICGDRNWTNEGLIEAHIVTYKHNGFDTLIHGNCRGADKIAAKYAKKHEMNVEPFKADWKKYGGSAGPIRNSQMIKEGKPDIILAFHNDLENSKGTFNMILQAGQNKIPFRIITEEK